MENSTRTILNNTLLFTIAPILPKVINIALLPIMTRYLTDVDFGISGTISAYSQAISAFATLGLSVVLANSFFKTPLEYKDTWRQIYGFLNLWMVVYAIAQAVLLYFIIPEEAIENRWWIIILTNFSTVFFGPTATIGTYYYQYNKQAFPIVWRSVMASVLSIAINYVLIVYLRWGYMGWYVGSFAGTFFSNASYWLTVNYKLGLSPNYRFKKSVIKNALVVSSPTIPHYYTSYLLESSGRIILDRYNISQGEIGRVNVVQQIGGFFSMVMQGLNQALYPFFMRLIKEGKEVSVKKMGLSYVTIVFLTAFTVSIWSKEIFYILISNESLRTAYPFCIAYIMALCYRPMYVIASNYNFFYEKTKQLLLVSFVAGIIALILYVILTPLLGIWGFFLGNYLASLYYGYAGYFFSCYRQYSKMNFPYLLLFFVQIGLTGAAFIIVNYIYLKCIVTVIVCCYLILVVYNNRFLIRKK